MTTTRAARAWAPSHYLKFESSRLQPALDLLQRIHVPNNVASIVDLGCGTGNITPFMRERWPHARIHCVDSSKDMLASARAAHAGIVDNVAYTQADFETFSVAEPVDVIFSNAALHWVSFDVHKVLLPRLFSLLKPGGVLAIQMPDTRVQASHVLMPEAARALGVDIAGVRWVTTEEDPSAYYGLFAAIARPDHIHLWSTEYTQVLLPAPRDKEPAYRHPVVDFVSSTGLGPYVHAIDDPTVREAFLQEYASRIAAAYPVQADGHVLFPFKRFFCVVQRDD
ncbi:hypothetical protein SPRG_05758 [Saprolegnia parasitica CBS 223.65]|uniref:Methyltransferase domain-containing protein n=1 Tax=Saprolegnia parasitica (strain CBS 223.65) TaxID=695850 RepID=A0A067CPZ2_SAPPC|nr:hypothetical protein SPRG_05758 [Saprolegnia parasitica CBS 223.65]KDO28887.1 hypothetical protein SPRG_05758 [Saprolegnia parasitica CBS 223.65]|eukprot:XP_012200431.1 hypothetical protein SPRG_05758 [Saprolegnia parasitica CBS 223.65]